MDSSDEELIVMVVLSLSVLEKNMKNAKENFQSSHTCEEGLNLECLILYCRK